MPCGPPPVQLVGGWVGGGDTCPQVATLGGHYKTLPASIGQTMSQTN